MKRISVILLSITMLITVFIPSYALGIISSMGSAGLSPLGISEADNAVMPRAQVLSAVNSERHDNEFVETSKTVIYDSATGDYDLKLETYVTGATITEETEERIPADIVLVMDHSLSMYDCIICNKSINPVAIFAPALDTNMVYYRGSDEVTGAVHYCYDCGGWFSDRHSSNYHGGMEYLPEYDGQEEYLRQFYSQTANVNCGGSCSHAAYKHPIYKDDMDLTQVYYRTAGSGNPVRYCSTCGSWYNDSATNQTKHSTGNHSTDRYYPFRQENDDDYLKIDRFFVPLACSASTTGELHFPRYIALQNSVNAFLDSIYQDSLGSDNQLGTDDDVAHRVAAVSFAGDNAGENSTNCILSFYDPNHPGDGRLTGPKIPYNQIDEPGAKGDAYHDYYYQHALQDVTELDQRATLDLIFASNTLSLATHTYKGMIMAKNILNLVSDDIKAEYNNGERNRVVVVFTDGVPYYDGNSFAKSSDALEAAVEIKNSIGATVYTVATFSGADGSDPQNLPAWSGEINKANRFMHLLSSNFLNARYCNPSNDNVSANEFDINPNLPSGLSFYLSAGNAEALSDIFQKIYDHIQSGGAFVDLDDSTVLLDIVTENFSINGNPTAHTETLTAIVNDVMQWSHDNNSLGGITVEGNTVKVTGFNYSDNYVGVDTDNGQTIYRGKKLVVNIPIHPHNTNTGGTEMETNAAGSGIYYPDENGVLKSIEDFSVPKADIPTTVTVKKIINGGSVPQFSFSTVSYPLVEYSGNDQSDGNYLEHQLVDPETHNFSLGNGGSFVIDNVAVGSTFKLSESVDLKDYNVSVVVTDADGTDITSSVLSHTNGIYTINSVVPSMMITITNSIRHADLIIAKNLSSGINPEQDFVFVITSPDRPEFNLEVVVPAGRFTNGIAEIAVNRLLLGRYTVTEITDWTWRYDVTDITAQKDSGYTKSDTQITFSLTKNGEKITFINEKTNDKWLGGEDYCENWFDGGLVKKRNGKDLIIQ